MRVVLASLIVATGATLVQLDQCLSIRGPTLSAHNKFTSPNFPDRYPPSVDCVRIIHSRPGHDIVVTFDSLFHIESTYDSVEHGGECPNDFIEFRDGRYGFSPLIGRYCGRVKPTGEIRAVSGYLWVRFRSDAMLEYRGFSAQYSHVPSRSRRDNVHQCLMEYINGLDGFLRTQDLVASMPINVTGTLDCVWRLEVPSNLRIALYIHEFTLTAPNQCGQNFVEVYPGGTADKPIRKFCGLSATDVFATSHEMFVRFFLSDVRLLNATRVTALFSSYTRKKNCTSVKLFACGDDNCVPSSLVCNNRVNCPYGRDEAVCHVAQDAVMSFATSGFAPLVLLIFAVLLVVSAIFVFTIRKNHCALPPL